MKNIMTGSAVVNMNPPVGLDMTGYIARESGSVGFHDELKIRCVVFDKGIERFAMIACDLLALDSEFFQSVAGLIERKTQIPADKIVIFCVHTHSGPASIHLQDCGEENKLWMDDLKNRISDCVLDAVNRLKLSVFSYRNGICETGVNRVSGNKGQSDTQVGTLVIHDADTGDIVTVIVNFACHAVVLDQTNLLYSKDFPHYLEAGLKENYGEMADIIFANGCGGDINPIYRGDFVMAEKVGRKLSESITAIKSDTITNASFGDGDISMDTIKLTIPLKHNLNEKNLNELKASFIKGLADEILKNGDGPQAKPYRAYINWSDRMLGKIWDNTLPNSVKAELKFIRIGPLVILTIPFEVFHSIGLRLKEHFGKYNTMIIGYANGDFGYLPSKELYAAAGYESGLAYRYYGYPGPVCENAEDLLFNAFANHG